MAGDRRAVTDVPGMTQHRRIFERTIRRQGSTYSGLGSVAKPFEPALPDPQAPVDAMPFGGDDLRAVRSFVAAAAAARGLGTERTRDLVLAASELVTNSLRHGGGTGIVRVWRQGTAVVCEVRDGGRFDRPLAGTVRPVPDQTSGFGLWIANQVCDLVQIRSLEDGSTVRLHVSAREAS
jgi:anti-sigma regulatory factor (Ser/Thr protein kinase)